MPLLYLRESGEMLISLSPIKITHAVYATMKLILSLQPGNKLQIPLEIPEDEVQSMTVADLKEKIMSFNKTKKIEELHVVYKSQILDDSDAFSNYNITDGETLKFLFAPILKGAD